MVEQKLGSFEALQTSTFKNGTVYQTYVTDQRLVAVKTGGQMDGGRAVTNHFGALGAIIGYFIEKRVQKKRAALRLANEARTLDELLLQDPKNFEVRFEALEKAELLKAGMMVPGKANLVLTLTGGAKDPIKLNLQSKESLAVALPLLEQGLAGRLQTDPKLRA